jgi:hypothetical protein
MYTHKIYALRWDKQMENVFWIEFEEIQKEDIGYFLDCDSGKARAIHYALEFANARSTHLNLSLVKSLCFNIWPHMYKTKQIQLRQLDKMRGL